jgi:hypothetical protein
MLKRIICAGGLAILSMGFGGIALAQDAPPGEIQIVRWDVLLNQGGADAIKKVGTPFKSDSQLYQGMACSGFELRQAVMAEIGNGGVVAMGRIMTFAKAIDESGSFRILPGVHESFYNGIKPNQVNAQFDALSSHEAYTRIGLDETNFSGRDIENITVSQIKISASIIYEGDLKGGDALAFMMPITMKSNKTFYIFTIWETFKSPESTSDLFQSVTHSTWWVANGPEKLRKMERVLNNWESQASHKVTDVPPAFEKKLSEGKTLKLAAICRPSDAFYCWWDGLGIAVSGAQNFDVNFKSDGTPYKGLVALLEMSDTGPELDLRTPVTRPILIQSSSTPPNQHFDSSLVAFIPDGATTLDVGVPLGPWIELAQMKVEDEKEIDGITYKTSASFPGGSPAPPVASNLSLITLHQSQPIDGILTLTAVGPDGREAKSMLGRGEMLTNKNPREVRGISVYEFAGIKLKDVKYFRLCERKTQWVTFSGFATQPVTPVKTDISSDDLSTTKQIQPE